MRYVMSRESREMLRSFLASKVLLAFDFDGTLAPIVDAPELARMRAGTRRLLRRLASFYPCVVLSGRSRADLRGKLAGSGIVHTIGNHGAEPGPSAQTTRRLIARWRAVLEGKLAPLQGVRIEDKGLSLTVHYRQSRQQAKARAEILAVARLLPGSRLIGGKLAISIIPKDAANKGTALLAMMARLKHDRALFVGDDETDEDVFSLPKPASLLTIRVGRKRDSGADYFLRNQRETDDLLRILLRVASGKQ
jgi:trehalose 6-phosphate phosphatase